MADHCCGTCDWWIVRPHHSKSSCAHALSFLFCRETDGEKDGRNCGLWQLRETLKQKETENG